MKKVIKVLLIAAAIYLLYVVVTGFLPYARSKSVSDPAVAADFYQDGTPCTDRVALVEEPLESLSARAYLLGEAEKTLDISYYAMHMGPSTDFFLAAILDAADRGVQVRILLDGMSGGLTSSNKEYAAALGAHENIELRLYNTVNPLRPWTFNGRLHDKYIIIDDRLLLLGGRNIGDKYFNPEGFDSHLSIDRDVLVYNTAWQAGDGGSVLSDVRGYMDGLWNSGDVTEPFGADTRAGTAKREELRALLQTAKQDHPGLFEHNTDYGAATYPAEKITFLHNGTEIGPKEPVVADALGALLRGAEKSVLLQSPYVVFDEPLETLLTDLGEKDISYEILTNSLASSPNLPAYSAYLNGRKKILATGATLREYQSEHAIHAKTYVVDARMSVVGSFNLDPRSAYIDTELMLAIDSEPFARQLLQTVGGYQAQSLRVSPDGGYIPDPQVAEQPDSGFKKALIAVLRTVIRPFTRLV